MRLRSSLAALLCGAALLGACGGTEAGSPTAAGGATASADRPSTTSSPAESSDRPTRPADIDLSGQDACVLSVEQVAASWGQSSEPRRDTMEGGTVIDGSPMCQYVLAAEQAGFSILTAADVGLGTYLDSVQQVPYLDVDVDGFPAVSQEGVSSRPQTGSGECYVHVDIADDQMLSVQFSQIAAAEDKRLPIETLCAKAREVASAAVTTLQGG